MKLDFICMSTENEKVEPEMTGKGSKTKPVVRRSQTQRRLLTVDDVIAYFAPCGRCGYFLSGVRAAFGRESLETAVAKAKGGWLTFPWHYDLQDLLLGSYGSRVEDSDYHFDGCCPECRRAFTYHALRSENHPALLRIEIKPRRRQ